MLYFSDLPLIVNGSGMVIESFNMTHQSPMEAIQALGFRGKNAFGVNGSIKTNLQLNYYPQLTAEPFYNLVNYYKDSSSPLSINVKIGDISGAFYLESLSYKITPNDIVKGTASLVSFIPTERTMENPNGSQTIKNDFAYGIYSYATLREEFQNRVFEFEYDFRANILPLYKIGQGLPFQVTYLGAEENFVFVHEFWKHPTVTGILYNIDDVTSITLAGTGDATFTFPLNEGIVKNLDMNANIQDIDKITTTVQMIY